jgi:hypothetical protein
LFNLGQLEDALMCYDLAIDNLKRAIDLHPEKCIEIAKEDPDFNNIRDEPDFQKAIGFA